MLNADNVVNWGIVTYTHNKDEEECGGGGDDDNSCCVRRWIDGLLRWITDCSWVTGTVNEWIWWWRKVRWISCSRCTLFLADVQLLFRKYISKNSEDFHFLSFWFFSDLLSIFDIIQMEQSWWNRLVIKLEGWGKWSVLAEIFQNRNLSEKLTNKEGKTVVYKSKYRIRSSCDKIKFKNNGIMCVCKNDCIKDEINPESG